MEASPVRRAHAKHLLQQPEALSPSMQALPVSSLTTQPEMPLELRPEMPLETQSEMVFQR